VSAEEIAARFAEDEVVYQNNVSLANTGSDFSGLFASAAALILLGAGSMVYARRKTS
jgi:LPXTG-motif cell wall-anchored protein